MRQQTLCDVSHYVRKNFSAKLDFLYTDLFVNDQKKRNVACLADNFFVCFFSYLSLSERYSFSWQKPPPPGGMGGTSLWEAKGDVLLDGVAFSWLDWIWWGRIFSRVTRMGSNIFGFFGVRKFFIFTVSKKSVPECLYSRWKVTFSSSSLKDGWVHKHRKWLSWDRKNYIFAQKWLRLGL